MSNSNYILIAEDELSLQYLVKMMLADYEIVIVDNGQKLVDSAKANPPKLILTDIMMPVMSGEEAVSLIKSDDQLKDIPVVALSAKTQPSDIDKMLELGFDDFLAKPVRKQQLLDMVNKYFNK